MNHNIIIDANQKANFSLPCDFPSGCMRQTCRKNLVDITDGTGTMNSSFVLCRRESSV